MSNLITGLDASNRPIFLFGAPFHLDEAMIPTGQLQLSGPSKKLDAAHWPVRGDLAHIRLAGICFVPHYAVPVPHVVSDEARLLAAPRDDAAVLGTALAGTVFNVLDPAGDWAWGQIGEDGLVGYLPLTRLRAS